MNWQPSAPLDLLKKRANILHNIRSFFADRNILEVETPLLAAASVSDPGLHSIAVDYAGKRFLQTSPEQHMKRLLAAGSGDIFQMCKAFRQDESGSRHNPEFTILEWYRCGMNLEHLAQESCQLIQAIAANAPTTVHTHSYSELCISHYGCDPITASYDQLLQSVSNDEQSSCAQFSRYHLVDYLFSFHVEPQLKALHIVTDFPPWQAALSQTRTRDDGAETSQRFEVYWQGIELANGYLELLDSSLLRERHLLDNQQRTNEGLDTMSAMTHLEQAMHHGLPACCGVALGIDRLVMIACEAQAIGDVISFTFDRA